MSQTRAVIFDLDGTAIPNSPDGMPSERLIAAVAKAQPTIKLCAATGRSVSNAAPILDALKLKNPCVISAGTQIIDPVSKSIIWQTVIEPADVERVIKICAPYHYEMMVGNELQGDGSPAATRAIDTSVNVIYIMACTETDATAMLAKLNEIPAITAAGVTSWTEGRIDIHITHAEATKEHAITELLQLIGVDQRETIGVGDANNDVHLFKAVGTKVAMGNATGLLKSHTDKICKSVDEDGLAQLLESLVI